MQSKRAVSLLLVGILFVCLLAGCGRQEDTTVTELYIYNSKGENAQQFEALAKEYEAASGIKVKVVTIGSGTDHMATLRAEINSKNPPDIFTVQSITELQEWKDGEIVVDFSDSEELTPEFQTLAEDIDPRLRLTTDGTNSYGVPYCIEGYGYIVDKQMLKDLFGLDDTDAILEDIRLCSYSDWESLVKALAAYITNGKASKVKINGTTYKLAKQRTGLAENLTGVFAVAGDENGKWTYSDHMLNVALNAVFENPAAAKLADEEEVYATKDVLMDYAQALDLMTQYAAGENGMISRGSDMISSSNNYDASIEKLTESKAVFLKDGNWAYNTIKEKNEQMAERLCFLPVKMPFTKDEITVEGYSVKKMNRTIPVFVPMYYAINNNISTARKKAAQDFLVWLNTSETGTKYITEDFAFIPYNVDTQDEEDRYSLAQSIVDYFKTGTTLSDPYHGTPSNWSSNIVGKKLYESYMTKEVWTEQDYEDIANFAIKQWIENLDY
jgi:raffinose/stachyose/melibiose transport system substrate-binding protein